MNAGADLEISAAGVKPNIGFVQSSVIACAHGVLTDEHLQTDVAGIYAAGDCAEALDFASGRRVDSAIQPTAADEAYCAGMNMAGKKTALRGVTQLNVLDTLGLVSTSFGEWQGVPGGEHAELSDEANCRFLRLEFGGDVLVGANCVGLTEHVGALRGLIQSRTRLGAWKDRLVQNPLALMQAYPWRTSISSRFGAAGDGASCPPDFVEALEVLCGRASQAARSFIGKSHASTAHCAAAISPKASM